MSDGSGGERPLRDIFNNDPSFGAAVSLVRWFHLRRTDGGSAGNNVVDFALGRLQAILTAASLGDPAALGEVVVTDPVSTLHAISLVPDLQARHALAESYDDILRNCSALGVDVVQPRALPVVELFFERLGCLRASGRRPDCRTAEAFTASGFALHALEASELARGLVSRPSDNLLFLSRASLLLSARRRNLSDAGLLLMAHAICFHDDDVSHVVEWLKRIRRSDGLYGSWELFARTCNAANLAASVNVEWALATRAALQRAQARNSSLAPIEELDEAFSPVDEEHLESALRELRAWVDRNLDRFLVCEFQDQTEYGDRIKPLVELVLALWVVTRIAAGSNHSDWARSCAARIEEMTRGEGLIEGIRIFPTSILAALMFPMLEQMTGQVHCQSAELESLARDRFSLAQERIPMRQMDYFFLRWLFGREAQADDDAIHRNLERALVSGGVNPCYLSNDAVYDVTHAIFYATKFGTARFVAAPSTRAWCARWVPDLCASFLLEDDLDIGGELLMNWAQLNLPRDGRFWFAVRLILSNLQPDGSAPGPARLAKYDKLSPFERGYHTTLIVLIALILALRRP